MNQEIDKYLFLEQADGGNPEKWGASAGDWGISATPGAIKKISSAGEIPVGECLVVRFLEKNNSLGIDRLEENEKTWVVWCHFGGDTVPGGGAKSPEAKWRNYDRISSDDRKRIDRANVADIPYHFSSHQELPWGGEIQRVKEIIRNNKDHSRWSELVESLNRAWKQAANHNNLDARLRFSASMLSVTVVFHRLDDMLAKPKLSEEQLAKAIIGEYQASGLMNYHPDCPEIAETQRLRRHRLLVEHAVAYLALLWKKPARAGASAIVRQRTLCSLAGKVRSYLWSYAHLSHDITDYLRKTSLL
ncbi:MAG: hypothetical protein LBU39_08375 [Desulfobulbaceae bacterium]|nr:hypothetical protein [Desulfobulbaceae bacterium]